MNTDVELPSGSKLHITLAPLEDAAELLRAVMGELKKIASVKNGADIDLGGMEVQFAIMTSVEIKNIAYKFMERSTYDGVKLTKDLFDQPDLTEKLRKDYIAILNAIINANISPFFGKTFSGLSGLNPTPAENPT